LHAEPQKQEFRRTSKGILRVVPLYIAGTDEIPAKGKPGGAATLGGRGPVKQDPPDFVRRRKTRWLRKDTIKGFQARLQGSLNFWRGG